MTLAIVARSRSIEGAKRWLLSTFTSISLAACSSAPPGGDLGSERRGADQSGGGNGIGGDADSGDISLPGDAADGDDRPNQDCAPKAIGLLRDFQSIRSSLSPIKDDESALEICPVYRDFQWDWIWDPNFGFAEKGIPAPMLASDRKPVISDPTRTFNTIASPETFLAWYRDDPACVKTFEYELPMEVSPATGNLVFDSASFFPLDGEGFGDSGSAGGVPHNYHFTFELHMTFVYRAGDVFRFTGDDDLWVFIDDKLALDLGGAHPPVQGTIHLDTLGLEPGQEYPIDFFHAERSESESNFHIETSLGFTNCNPIIIR